MIDVTNNVAFANCENGQFLLVKKVQHCCAAAGEPGPDGSPGPHGADSLGRKGDPGQPGNRGVDGRPGVKGGPGK